MAGEAIFVCYRRDDTADVAGRVYDAMAQRFGKQRVFKDVDNIGPGVDFGDYIKTVLPRCRVALVLVGPHWLESKDEIGKRRLDDDQDWVRIEIEAALATPGVLAVPVLVNGARMPRGEEVPDSLKPLLRRNAAIIRRDPDFHDDVERLATAIRSSVNTGVLDLSKIGGKSGAPAPASAPRKSKMPLLIGASVAVFALVAIGFGVSRYFPQQFAPEQSKQHLGAGVATEPSVSASAPQTPSENATQEVAQQLEMAPPIQRTVPTTSRGRRAGETFRDCADCPEMVVVPSGTFVRDGERVAVSAFASGVFEVTQAEWGVFAAELGLRTRSIGSDPRFPAGALNWHEAVQYTNWLSSRTGQRYRLLTRNEWLYAVRGRTHANADEPLYWWGNTIGPGNANYRASAPVGPRPVGSYPPNAFGVYDMVGNTWEWLQDCFGSDCSSHEVGGGSWLNDAEYLASNFGGSNPAAERYTNIGLRVARDLE